MSHKNRYMILKTIVVLFLSCLIIIGSSCSTSRKSYRPKKRRKNDCDCSKWSYNNTLTQPVKYFIAVEFQSSNMSYKEINNVV